MSRLNELWKNFKSDLIYLLIIALLVCSLCLSINRCSNAGGEYKHNIEALKDTIKYYQDKNGNLVATKLAFESDIKTLKLLNEDLYNQIDSLKLKKDKVKEVIIVKGEIDNGKKDSSYVIKHDTISKGFDKTFNFNDKYRTLEGNATYKDDIFNININKDVIYFDYTLALDKNNRVYIKSTNPYVKYNELSGFTLPSYKRKPTALVLGPSVGYGYDFTNNKFVPTIGFNITWGFNLLK